MGYNTDFEGELLFKDNITVPMLADFKKFLGEDCRDHKEWEGAKDFTYVDLELTSDMLGIQWNGSEKSYNMVEIINMIIHNMRKKYPEFGFKGGRMEAKGEDFDDRWAIIVLEDGTVDSEDSVVISLDNFESLMDAIENMVENVLPSDDEEYVLVQRSDFNMLESALEQDGRL